jgi:ATP-binding cassette, subfamily C, bacterial exporter for protease/lipase
MNAAAAIFGSPRPAHGTAPLLQPLRRELLAMAFFSAVANLLLLVPTLYLLQVYDRVLVSQSTGTLVAVSLLALLLLAAMAFSEAARSQVLIGVGVRLERALGGRVFQGSFAAALAGGRERAAQGFPDLQQVRQFATGPGIFAFFDAPWVPLYIGVTFLLHPLLGALALVFAAVQAVIAWGGHSPAARRSAEASQSARAARDGVADPLRAAETLTALGMVAPLRRRWLRAQSAAVARHAAAQDWVQRLSSASKFVRYFQQSLGLAAGALLVIDGQLTPGAMIAANLLIGRALAPVDQVVSQWRGLLEAREAFTRLRALVDGAVPAEGREGHAGKLRGAVQLRGLVANAPDRTTPILKGLSLEISAGQTVVVLGASGAGKSTLARCILGIWPDTAGELLLDGVPAGAWRRDALAPQLAYLPQDLQLFDGTVAENIARMGEPDAGQVIAAARASGLHETILRLPAGYDTPIGPGGSLLSGGQRQRLALALARALYGDPALLVLDEPNASLDKDGERALGETLKELRRQGRTVILIAQRLSTFQFADRVLLLRDGEVAAWGPPSAVLAPAT